MEQLDSSKQFQSLKRVFFFAEYRNMKYKWAMIVFLQEQKEVSQADPGAAERLQHLLSEPGLVHF